MLGTIKVLKGVQNENIYPTTLSDAVFVDPDVTLSEKLKELEFHKSDLIVDLKRWGIVEGLPTKPYTNANYQTAKRNIMGFNNVLKYARENGYKHVILPKGKYSICYPFEIKLQSHVTFNLGGSTFKVMYDSNNRSPFDTSSDPIFNFGGISFAMSGVKHAHLMNGIIIGDVYERSFTDGEEHWYEHSYGVSINQGTSFSSVSHCEIRGYMGDNINVVSGGVIRKAFVEEWYNGLINKVDGKTIGGSTAHVYTAMINFPAGSYDQTFSLAGQGYSRLTGLNEKYFDVFFYDSTDKFIGVLERRKVQAPIPIPDKAKKYRLQFYNQDINKDPAIFLDYGSNCHHNVMEYNLLADGHRGAITMGGSYNIIQFNEITRNGKYSNTFLDGVPTFPDPTRYAINQEDSFGDNCMILNNHISDGFHGILVGCYSTHIENNIINNIDYGGIIIYSVDFGSIEGNYLDGCSIVYMTSSLYRAIDVKGNYVRGDIELAYADEYTLVSHNYINGRFEVGTARFSDNLVEIPNDGEETHLDGMRLKNSIIRSEKEGTRLAATFTVMGSIEMCDIEFKDLDIQFNFATNNLKQSFKDCIFSNCRIRSDSLDLAKEMKLTRCTLKNGTSLYPQMVNGTKQMLVFLEDCEIYLTDYLLYLGGNYANAIKFRLKDSRIFTSGTPGFLISSEYSSANIVVTDIVDNEFTHTGTALTTMKYFNSEDRAAPNSMIADNVFTNMTMVAITQTSKIALYNRRTAFYQSVTLSGSAAPYTANITHNLGTSFVNTLITIADGTVQTGVTVKVTGVNTIQLSGSSALALNVFVKKM